MKKKLFVFLALILTFSSLATGQVYAQGEEHHSYIDGYADETIKPANKISREEAAKVLDKAFKLNKLNDSELNFKDLGKGWSYDSVKKTYDNGLIKGDEDGKFRPRDSLKRGEAVAIIVRYQDPDLDNISIVNPEYKNHWAAKEIQYALDKEIITGYKDGSVKINNEISRAEFITIINSILGRECEPDNIEILKNFKDVGEKDWFYKDIVRATNDHIVGDIIEKPTKAEEKPVGNPGNSSIPYGFTPEAIMKTNETYWRDMLEWENISEEGIQHTLKYFDQQVKLELIDYNMQQKYKSSRIGLKAGIETNIGGSMDIGVDAGYGDKDKGMTITTYIENGPEWNELGKPFVRNYSSNDGIILRQVYRAHYNDIVWNGLNFHMVPTDVIKATLIIDFNNGDFLKYRFTQDVENKYFRKELFGIDKQWNHDTKPIKYYNTK